MRSIVNALTVRGEQFTIYSLGQSIRIVQGKTNVLSEAYIQSVVERVVTNLPPYYVAPSNVYYRTLYNRILSE